MAPIKFFWKKWLAIAQAIGNFQAQVILSLFYLVVMMPLGLVFGILADPLNVRKRQKSNFARWEHEKDDLKNARKQY